MINKKIAGKDVEDEGSGKSQEVQVLIKDCVYDQLNVAIRNGKWNHNEPEVFFIHIYIYILYILFYIYIYRSPNSQFHPEKDAVPQQIVIQVIYKTYKYAVYYSSTPTMVT